MTAILKPVVALLLASSFLAAPATAAVDCHGVQASNTMAKLFINQGIDDEQYPLTKRKTLVIHRVDNLDADGCDVELVLDVTIERKLRRNAQGTITVSGTFDLEDGDLILTDAHIEDIDVSHLSSLGELIFRGIANWLMDDVIRL